MLEICVYHFDVSNILSLITVRTQYEKPHIDTYIQWFIRNISYVYLSWLHAIHKFLNGEFQFKQNSTIFFIFHENRGINLKRLQSEYLLSRRISIDLRIRWTWNGWQSKSRWTLLLIGMFPRKEFVIFFGTHTHINIFRKSKISIIKQLIWIEKIINWTMQNYVNNTQYESL